MALNQEERQKECLRLLNELADEQKEVKFVHTNNREVSKLVNTPYQQYAIQKQKQEIYGDKEDLALVDKQIPTPFKQWIDSEPVQMLKEFNKAQSFGEINDVCKKYVFGEDDNKTEISRYLVKSPLKEKTNYPYNKNGEFVDIDEPDFATGGIVPKTAYVAGAGWMDEIDQELPPTTGVQAIGHLLKPVADRVRDTNQYIRGVNPNRTDRAEADYIAGRMAGEPDSQATRDAYNKAKVQVMIQYLRDVSNGNIDRDSGETGHGSYKLTPTTPSKRM